MRRSDPAASRSTCILASACALFVASCRIDYDLLAAAGGGGGSGAVPSGGSIGSGGSAGSGAVAGIGASPGSGGTSSGGSGGAGTACTTTADCTCEVNGGHTYWFCVNTLLWNDAAAWCATIGMSLVRIDDSAENDWVRSVGLPDGVFTLNDYALIGASDQAVAGEWRWPDGTLFWQGGSNGTAVSALYENWDLSSPSASGTAECSVLFSAGLWQDHTCGDHQPFICESN